jgi:methylated-DNA-protein-cysteine methyltransferase-like protein
MMSRALLNRIPAKANLLALLRNVPSGRVTTFDALAEKLNESPALVRSLLSQLTEEERDFAPWHRVVARGGAIGRGLHRDQQFARLVREGVLVSPAGIVHDMPRFFVKTFDARSPARDDRSAPASETPAHSNRSRGMKSRP